jgi:branched-subunit amino acid transport protein
MNVWLAILGMGAITLGLRLSMLVGRGELPPLLRRALRYVPFAVLTAIFMPELLMPPPANTLFIALDNSRLIAGTVAIAVALRTRSVLLTIAVGMVSLWALLLLKGAL